MDEDVPVEEGSYTWTQDNDEVLDPRCDVTLASALLLLVRRLRSECSVLRAPKPSVHTIMLCVHGYDHCGVGRDVKCTIKSKSIALGIATLPNPEVLQGNFSATVDPDDTNWSIENSDGRRLVRVTIAKANAGQSWAELMAPN